MDSVEDPDSATMVKMMLNVNYADSAGSETSEDCASTDGDESDPNSPICSD